MTAMAGEGAPGQRALRHGVVVCIKGLVAGVLLIGAGVVPADQGAAAPPAGKTDEQGAHSPANTLLFLTDHLSAIDAPATLHYRFARSGSLEPPLSDSVDLRITEPAQGGGKNVAFRFLSGKEARSIPEVEHARGNPVLMVFLQHDVGEMRRLTEGSWQHFQRMIKLALADDAEMRSVQFDFQGRKVQGTQVRIHPYREDPYRTRFTQFAEKSYAFTFSPEVPGWVYELHIEVPAPAQPSQAHPGALIEETLRLDRIESSGPSQ